jgi:hypothetical protein
MKDDSNRGRVDLKDSTRHVHLDVNGMDIDVEPEDSATNGELYEVIVDGVPKPIDPIMEVMGILLRVEAVLKEADTCMQDGVETSWWQLTDARPSVSTLQQARQLLLTRLKRCCSGHRLSTILEKQVMEDALTCNLHKIGASLVEKVVDVRLHPEPLSQTTQDRVQFKSYVKGCQGVAEDESGQSHL